MNPNDRAAWDNAIRDFTERLLLDSRSRRTAEFRATTLKRFSREFSGGPGDVLPRDITAFIVGHGWAAQTQANHLTGLKKFYQWATPHLVAVDPTLSIAAIKVPRRKKKPAVDLDALIAAMNAAPERERRMMELAAYLGLKVNEIAAFDPAEIKRDKTGVWTLTTRWEGGNSREVPVPTNLLAEYRAMPPGYMLPGKVAGHFAPATVARYMNAALPAGMTSETIRGVFSVAGAGYHSAGGLGLPAELVNPVALQQTLFKIERDLENEPGAAISECKNVLELLFSGVLDDAGVAYGSEKLPKFYRLASERLSIDVAGNKTASEATRNAMGALVTTVQSVAEMRNSVGTGHASGASSDPEPRHARLAFNATVAVSEFVADTWRASKLP